MSKTGCSICKRASKMCGAGAGGAGGPGFRPIHWCARPKCRAEAQRRIDAHDRVRGPTRRRDRGLDKLPVGEIGMLAAPAAGGGERWHVVDRFDVGSSRARAACDHRLELEGARVDKPRNVLEANRCKRVGCAAHWPRETALDRRLRGIRQIDELLSNRSAPKPPSSPATTTTARAPAPYPRASARLAAFAHNGRITLQRKLVRCGKNTCEKLHGPYWYAYWKEGERTRCKYVGRAIPPDMERDSRFQVCQHHRDLEAAG